MTDEAPEAHSGGGTPAAVRLETSLSGDDWQVMHLLHNDWRNRKLPTAPDLEHLALPTFPWLPARVPGHVQSDLVDAGELPDPWLDRNSFGCEWTSARDWVYWKRFRFDGGPTRATRLVFDGVDHSCHVFLNGHALGAHEGMFRAFSFDVTEQLRKGDNDLIVIVDRAPSEPDVQGSVGFTQDISTWKARFSYGWDWCPRLVPVGIWGDVRLVSAGPAWLGNVFVRPTVTVDQAVVTAIVSVTVELESDGGVAEAHRLEVLLRSPSGHEVARQVAHVAAGDSVAALALTVPDPELWHPNGSGSQPLYVAEVALETAGGQVIERRSVRTGLRLVRWLPNDDAPADALPYVLEVNSTRIFIKGWNWIPVDQLYGRPHEERYRRLVELAQHAHCNLLRVWGGGLLERELFYDLCDEAGILVWQEFPQSSSGAGNEPAVDDAYLKMARETAVDMVRSRRNHPSLAVWCGGNELLDGEWVPLTVEHPALAALAAVVDEYDPDTLFIPASPQGPLFMPALDRLGEMYDIHGGWSYRGDADHYAFYDTIDPLLHSEFGAEGATNLTTLRRTVSDRHVWPPDRTNPAWVHRGSWWLHRPMVESLFGPVDCIEDYVAASQWVQTEALRYSVEAARRRTWRTSGTIPWQFNESFPNASCTNVVDYFGHPKPAYWSVRAAYSDVAVSLQYPKLQWAPGELAEVSAWCVTDAGGRRDLELDWQWTDVLQGTVLSSGTAAIVPSPGAATRASNLSLEFPSTPGIYAVSLSARADAVEVASNQYLFSSADGAPFTRLLHSNREDLDVHINEGTVTVSSGGGPVYGLALCSDDAYGGPVPDSGYVHYLPAGKRRTFEVTGSGSLVLSAMNAAAVRVGVRPRRTILDGPRPR